MLPSETHRAGASLQVLSIWANASCSACVTVSAQVVLMVIQSVAYWHQYERLSGFQSSGPRAPFERLALAVTAMRCWGSSR